MGYLGNFNSESFLHQVFIEYLQSPRYCSRCWRYMSEQNMDKKPQASWATYLLVEEDRQIIYMYVYILHTCIYVCAYIFTCAYI